MDRKIKRGDMFYSVLTQGVGSEQSGKRPVLIISNDTGNKQSGTVIVAAITSKTERKYIMPTHCRIQAMYGLPRVSYIMLETITYHRQIAAWYVYRNAERENFTQGQQGTGSQRGTKWLNNVQMKYLHLCLMSRGDFIVRRTCYEHRF